MLIYADEADCEPQLAEWRAKSGKGAVIMLPGNGRERLIDRCDETIRGAAHYFRCGGKIVRENACTG